MKTFQHKLALPKKSISCRNILKVNPRCCASSRLFGQSHGQWQFDIPSASLPANKKLTFYASKESAFLYGEKELVLGREPRPSITIMLEPGKPDFVRGMVQDETGAALAGARVSVVGYPGETFITKEDGQFVLPAHKATDQQVEIHIEADGFQPYNFHHPAGSFPGVFRLHRK